jgi:hypothetical protein
MTVEDEYWESMGESQRSLFEHKLLSRNFPDGLKKPTKTPRMVGLRGRESTQDLQEQKR